MGSRHRSIRFRIFLLVTIPALALIGVYAVAVGISAGNALRLASATRVTSAIRLPNTRVQTQLDAESMLAVAYLATPTSSSLAALTAQEHRTDRVIAHYRIIVRSAAVTSNASAAEKQAITAEDKALSGLPAIRTEIAAQSVRRLTAVDFYSNLVMGGFRVYDGSIEQATSVPLVTQGLYLTKLGEADQIVLDQTELLTSSLAAGSFTAADRAEFAKLTGSRRLLLEQTLPGLHPPYLGFYHKYVSAAAATSLAGLENAVIGGPERRRLPSVQPLAWNATAGRYALGLATALQKSGNAIAVSAHAQAVATYLRLALIGGLGLLAILVSLAVSLVTSRRLIAQLSELQQSALELATERLPAVMRRLRSGEDVDTDAEVLALTPSHDEIGQVQVAFNMVQQAAFEAAADEARIRQGVSEVFRNLARRSQALLHRQLSLLDDLESKAAQPEELDNLFRIDHLTTRMRRQAESLIVLSGELPGRGWRNPVPLVDVVRAAAAEVEDYRRIRVMVPTTAALAGAAVADVIHLIAELAENGTMFSPPNTPVRIFGDIVGRGFAVEIEDRGVGLPDERLAEINRDLSDPPEFDLSGSDRIGLFITGQLARRHGIEITLRKSPFGGVTAVILIPQNLVVAEGAYESDPSATENGGPPITLAGRHALRSNESDNGSGSAGSSDSSVDARSQDTRRRALSAVQVDQDDHDEPPRQQPDGWLPAPAQITHDQSAGELPTTAEIGPAQPFSVFDPSARHARSHAPDEPTRQIPAAEPGEPALPVRARQASLAPQLRSTPGPDLVPDTSQGSPSAEAARSKMAAMQRGWERGRAASGIGGPKPDATNGTEPIGSGPLASNDQQHNDQH